MRIRERDRLVLQRDAAWRERDWARAENAALRRVVDADIEMVDVAAAMQPRMDIWDSIPESLQERYDDAIKTRDEALAAYRAEYGR